MNNVLLGWDADEIGSGSRPNNNFATNGAEPSDLL
jgi:hypothetical protein